MLAILAIGDLIVGVSNDAVNFLNSAIGSKAISFKNIMILASLGIAIGAISSSGMMEVARKGIFNPAAFNFEEIIYIFTAVMITDIFASREKDDHSTNSNLIIDEMLKLNHKNVSYVSSEEIVKKVKSIGAKGDIFLTMGAGNIWRYAEELGKHYND